MAGGQKKRKRRRGKKRMPGGSRRSPSTSTSSDDISDQPAEGEGQGLAAFPSEAHYEWGWHKYLFIGTNRNVDIMGSVRNQLLSTCFICAILYAAEQDIRRWLAIEEPERNPEIYFDYDTYVAQYESEVEALIGQDVRFFHRTRGYRPNTALNVFLRDGVLAYSKSKEWPGGKIIKISKFQFHLDMEFLDFHNIIATGGSVIGGFPVGPEFKNLKPDEIYEFSPIDIKREPAGAHMVQFIGTGRDLGREFLVFLNSKKRFGKNGVGKVYFDQLYKGVYTLQCRAPPPPPPSDDPGLIVAGPDDNDDTLGSSGAAPGGNNSSSYLSGAPDDSNAPSSTASTKSLSQVGKGNRHDYDPVSSSSCTIKIDGWGPSAPTLLVEDIKARICASTVKIERMSKQLKANLPPPPEFLFCVATESNNCYNGPWKKKNLDEIGTVTQCFVRTNKVNDLLFTNVLLKISDKLSGLNSKLALEHWQSIPIANRIPQLLGWDLSHGSPGLSDIPSSAWVSKNQHGRKQEHISSSGPANSSGVLNTTGPFLSLASLTPYTLSMPWMHHNANISSCLVVFGADASGARESPTGHIVDMNHFLEDKKAMEKHHHERRKVLLMSQADTAIKQEHKMASQIYGLAICHKESATLYANMSLCKLLVGDGEGALSDALGCRMLRPDCANACFRQAAALMLLKEYAHARDALLAAQKLDPENAETESEIRKAMELIKNPPAESAY